MANKRLRAIYHRLPLRWRPPRGARKYRALNEESQWWPVERIQEHQLARLRGILTHARENVPYYTGLIRQAGIDPEGLKSLEDLRSLPILEKQVVRDKTRALTADDWKRWKPVTHVTGGSTGQRLAVLMGRAGYYAHLADQMRHYDWAGYHFGDRLAMFTPHLQDFDRQEQLFDFHRPRNTLFVNGRLFSQETLAAMTEALARFRPEAIIASPSHLHLLCQYLAEKGMGAIRPRALMTTSEMLYDFQREEIGRFFGTRVYDFYGMSEHAAGGAECEAGRYHMSLEYTVTEVLRPDGTPAQPGEMGEIIGTNLVNYAMPLIRYRTGDLGVPAEGPCPCGRTLPALERVSGRSQDLIVTPRGVTVFSSVRFSFHDIRTVKEVQIVQEDVSRFRIRAAVADGYRPEHGQKMAQALARGLGYEATVTVEPVSHLARTEQGKLRLVECRVPLNTASRSA
ncbi:MAG: phenylacetate--CoA ligase family protein [Armatimonadetes bacterium]|nr:phenylacetate--CoA ligase family protein [Armatimonadota bacterium]